MCIVQLTLVYRFFLEDVTLTYANKILTKWRDIMTFRFTRTARRVEFQWLDRYGKNLRIRRLKGFTELLVCMYVFEVNIWGDSRNYCTRRQNH